MAAPSRSQPANSSHRRTDHLGSSELGISGTIDINGPRVDFNGALVVLIERVAECGRGITA
jgi:hypothetical protein